MRTLVLGLLLLLPAVAAADEARYRTTLDARIDDPDGKVTVANLTDTVRTADGTSLDACWKKPGTMTVKIVFDKSRVAAMEASGNGDRDAEVCVARVLRAISLPNSEGRVAATIELVGVARPLKVMFLGTKNRKVLDRIIDQNLSTSLGKFTGIPGRGPGTGLGVGTGTGSTRGTGGGSVSGDFVAGKGSIEARTPPGATVREVKVDVRQRPLGDLNERTSEEIHRVIGARLGIFRACYQKELNRTPGIAGKVVVKVSIQPDGSVSRVLVDTAKTTLPSESVIACIKSNMARLMFPAKGTSSEVSYPFVFSTGG